VSSSSNNSDGADDILFYFILARFMHFYCGFARFACVLLSTLGFRPVPWCLHCIAYHFVMLDCLWL